MLYTWFAFFFFNWILKILLQGDSRPPLPLFLFGIFPSFKFKMWVSPDEKSLEWSPPKKPFLSGKRFFRRGNKKNLSLSLGATFLDLDPRGKGC